MNNLLSTFSSNFDMKYFIKKLIQFSLMPLLAGGVFFLILSAKIDKNCKNITFNKAITTLIAGDSHIEQAINDSLIPNTLNIGINAESFYFSYYKFKLLFENNPAIKHLYLGISYHSLSKYYDRFIFGDYSEKVAPKYFFLLPVIEQIKILYWNLNRLAVFLRLIAREGFSQAMNTGYFSFTGGFTNNFHSTKASPSSMKKRLNFQFYRNGQLIPFSKINITYLKKIIELCKKHEVSLTLLNTPLHKFYDKNIPAAYKKKLKEIIEINKLTYIDLSDLKLNDSQYIPDGDHVSSSGAIKTSQVLERIIKNSR